MRKIAFLLLLVICFFKLQAQSITVTQEWNSLIKSLRDENWQETNRLSILCLDKVTASKTEDDIAALLRYMCIFSESALVNFNNVTQDEAIKKVAQFEGQAIMLPAYPVSVKFAPNSILTCNYKTDSLFISATNRAGTNIFCFEYIIPGNKWRLEDFNSSAGKFYRLKGILKSISTEGHILFPRFKLIIDQVTYTSENH